jgi:ribose 1,5-bisphosphokinase PhnN
MANGSLFYVIGPSGSGKDSLMAILRVHMMPAAKIMLR